MDQNSKVDQESKEFDYLKVLQAVESMPFNVGRNLLIGFLCGDAKNESIKRNWLERKALFGFFQLYTRREMEDTIENLMHNGLIEYKPLKENKFMKVIELTAKGKREIISPALYKKKLSNNFSVKDTEITENDRAMFSAFDFFLKSYNDEQKKSIVSPKSRILCVAGAGSGKTTVLTKRIEFLAAFRSVNPCRILAITFTRKARTEMAARLSKSQYCNGVFVETFNSFCEKILKQYNDMIYKRSTRVVSYGEKIKIFKAALKENGIDANFAVEQYFSFGQKRGKTNEELIKILMNDCYSILELHKMGNADLEELKNHAKEAGADEQKNIEMVYKICRFIDSFTKKFGLRDYSDQMGHCIKFLREHPELIPSFEHVLVDEYQDVNSMQICLLEILNPKNLFCVGDPRQSIFGWRGSKIKHIMNFEEKYPDCEIVTLSTNYRSSRQIVELINKSLENIRLPELKHSLEYDAEISLLNFDSEDEEMQFVISKIINLEIPRSEIFVLARTNRIISELSQRMKLKGIRHLVRTEEHNRDEEAALDEVTLATVHSIKGLEAGAVFVIGCTGMNFPCKASDHPIIEIIKADDYDKEEEERRLFYVALSRAKNRLYLTYSGKSHTRFINQKMLEIIGSGNMEKPKIEDKILTGYNNNYNSSKNNSNSELDTFSRLKMWRSELSRKLSLPAYIIMHDKTLMEIASRKPVDLEDLRNISGIGPAKLERYGNEIIGIVNGKT